MKITTKSLRYPSSLTFGPSQRRAAAPSWEGLTLLVVNEKSPNRSIRSHPPRRWRRRTNRRLSFKKIWRSPSQKKSWRTTPLSQVSRHRRRGRARARKTFLEKTSPPPPEHCPTKLKPYKPGQRNPPADKTEIRPTSMARRPQKRGWTATPTGRGWEP
jgi:hypothetical protein